MLLGYKITLAFMRILSLLCVCFLSLFVFNVSAQVVEKVFDILGRDSLSVQRNITVSDSDSIRLVDIQAELAAAKLNEANLRMEVEQMKLAAFVADSLKLAKQKHRIDSLRMVTQGIPVVVDNDTLFYFSGYYFGHIVFKFYIFHLYVRYNPLYCFLKIHCIIMKIMHTRADTIHGRIK